MTQGIQKSYAEISYSLEESEAEAAKKDAKETKGKDVPRTGSTRKSDSKKGQSSEDGDNGSFDDDNDSVEEGS